MEGLVLGVDLFSIISTYKVLITAYKVHELRHIKSMTYDI